MRSRAAISTDLREELGDLLLQVVFHARMAEEQGAFDFGERGRGDHREAAAPPSACVRRPARAFGQGGRGALAAHQERGEGGEAATRETGALAGVPVGLPALTRALKLQQKAGKVGFDWNDPLAVLAKIREEADEIEADIKSGKRDAAAAEVGDLLVRGGQPRPPPRRRSGSDAARDQPEIRAALRLDRERAGARGKTPAQSTLAEMDALWDAAKAAEK